MQSPPVTKRDHRPSWRGALILGLLTVFFYFLNLASLNLFAEQVQVISNADVLAGRIPASALQAPAPSEFPLEFGLRLLVFLPVRVLAALYLLRLVQLWITPQLAFIQSSLVLLVGVMIVLGLLLTLFSLTLRVGATTIAAYQAFWWFNFWANLLYNLTLCLCIMLLAYGAWRSKVLPRWLMLAAWLLNIGLIGLLIRISDPLAPIGFHITAIMLSVVNLTSTIIYLWWGSSATIRLPAPNNAPHSAATPPV
jgi:hypothetical protein